MLRFALFAALALPSAAPLAEAAHPAAAAASGSEVAQVTAPAAEPKPVLSPRDAAILAYERNPTWMHVYLESRLAFEAVAPTHAWRVWDPAVDAAAVGGCLRVAQETRTGSIRGPETQHLIHMEQEARRVAEQVRCDGRLADSDRETVLEAFGDAGLVIFYDHGGARRVRPAIAARLDAPDLRAADAAELFEQFIRLGHVHRMLAGPPHTPAKRAALEAEFAQLAAQLYE
jgi:hypothetical protein